MLEVGRVVKPHGLKGDLIVDMVTNRPERRLRPGGILTTDQGDLEVVSSRPHQGRWIVVFAGYDDRDGAESLRGRVLLAEPLAEEGALWVHELIGSEVVDLAGRTYGPVEAVEANAASDLLVLADQQLVPLTFVISHAGGRVVIDPPAGLLE